MSKEGEYLNTNSPEHGKSKESQYFKNQKIIVLNSFAESPKTMLQVSEQTGIRRANVCRYVAELESNNQIMAVTKAICPISKHAAKYYYTIPKLF